ARHDRALGARARARHRDRDRRPQAGREAARGPLNPFERPQPTPAEKIMLAERDALDPASVEAMFDEIGLLVLEGDAAGLAKKVSELSAAMPRKQLPAPGLTSPTISRPLP